jgi:hypothetical protein
MFCTPTHIPHFISVSVEHHHVDGGHTIPMLSAWFANKPYINCCVLTIDGRRLSVYTARRSNTAAISKRTCSFIAFQYDANNKYLIDWHSMIYLRPHRVQHSTQDRFKFPITHIYNHSFAAFLPVMVDLC